MAEGSGSWARREGARPIAVARKKVMRTALTGFDLNGTVVPPLALRLFFEGEKYTAIVQRSVEVWRGTKSQGWCVEILPATEPFPAKAASNVKRLVSSKR
jgi:hypothetical protein